MHEFDIPLRGAGGEPVHLNRTIASHGLARLPPFEPLDDRNALRVTLPLSRGRPRIVEIAQRSGVCVVTVKGRAPSPALQRELLQRVRHMLALDHDLSDFYALAVNDPALSWATTGAGRMLRSATMFEDVVKTICTTNCAWSGTVRMVTALVEHLGSPAHGAPSTGWSGRAFPTPEAMAATEEAFYRDVVRAGYRGRYLIELARSVAEGDVDLEAWGTASRDELPDHELAARLRTLPGVGPYAAAHIMMMSGRHSQLIFDSWTRPTYARLVGRRSVGDTAIQRRFRRYGPHAGLAFWLFLTRAWIEEPTTAES